MIVDEFHYDAHRLVYGNVRWCANAGSDRHDCSNCPRTHSCAFNPETGERISIKAGEAATEIQINGQWYPFIRFRDGNLATKYVSRI
jgi:hypothetical protein